MTVLEQFSLFQRIAGSIKADVEEGKTAKALGKLEILEGELATLRKDYEEPDDGGEELAPANFMNESETKVIN